MDPPIPSHLPSLPAVSPFPNEGGEVGHLCYLMYSSYTIIPVYILGVGESDRRPVSRPPFRRAEAANTTLAMLSPCRRLVL